MADCASHESEKHEGQQGEAVCRKEATTCEKTSSETCEKKCREADPAAGDVPHSKGEETDETAEQAARKRKSEGGHEEDDVDEPKKAKADDDEANGGEVEPNGKESEKSPAKCQEVAQKTVEDVQRLSGEADEKLAA